MNTTLTLNDNSVKEAIHSFFMGHLKKYISGSFGKLPIGVDHNGFCAVMHTGHPALSEQVFNISVTKIETIINPNRITDNVGRKTVTLICIHSPMIARSES